jgi:hypothetical protein
MSFSLPTTSRANHLSRTYPKQAAPKPERDPIIEFHQMPAGDWRVSINGGTMFPATIIDLAQHKRILELEAQLEMANALLKEARAGVREFEL